jgi:RP/EB family microtubule-associated protein
MFQSNLTKIEDMSTGAAYCLLTDRLFPGSVPLAKVKWNTKSDTEAIANWKLVQNSWHALEITKVG